MEQAKRFLLPVTVAEEELLTKQGVEFSKLKSEKERKILVGEKQIKHCLLLLRKAILFEQPTGTPGVYRVLLVPMEPAREYESGEELFWYRNVLKIPAQARELLFRRLCPPKPEKEEKINWIEAKERGWASWPDRNAFVRLATATITPLTKRKVQIHRESGWTDPICGPDFYIHLHAAPRQGSRETKNPPGHIWGIKVSNQGSGTIDSHLGISIVDEKTGYAVAELIGLNNLYFHHNISDNDGDRDELKIFKEVLKRVEIIIKALAAKEKEKISADWLHQEVFVISEPDHYSQTLLEGLYGGATSLVKTVLTPVINRNVCLHGGDFGREIQPFYDNMFHIFFGISPGLAIKNTPLSPLAPWGIRIKYENSLLALNKGITLYDDQGQTIAWLINGNNLYLPFNLSFDSKENREFFTRLLSEVARLLNSTATERQQWQAELAAKHKTIYVSVCQQYKKDVADKIKTENTGNELADTASQIKNLQTQLVAAIRKHDASKEILEGRGAGIYQAKFAADFDRMGRLEKIQNISFTPDCLIVETDTLYYQHPEKKETYLIGAFQIVIPFTGSYDQIRFFNLTQRVDTPHSSQMNAPHVYKDGHACLGSEMREILPPLFKSMDFMSIIIMCVVFLESANLDDIGGYVNRWPLVTTK